EVSHDHSERRADHLHPIAARAERRSVPGDQVAVAHAACPGVDPAIPPTLVRLAPAWTITPASLFGTAAVPAKFVPMKLFSIAVPLPPTTRTPAASFPEI